MTFTARTSRAYSRPVTSVLSGDNHTDGSSQNRRDFRSEIKMQKRNDDRADNVCATAKLNRLISLTTRRPS